MKKINLEKFNEVIYYDKCDNGLDVYMLVNEKVSNFYATLSVNYGSIDTKFRVKKKEYSVNNGVAHFLEHVKFNISEGLTAHDIFNKLGSSINAFTTYEFTCYEVFGNNKIKENIDCLLDYVETPYFTDKLVEKEKGIIVEEVKMGNNRPGSKLYYALNNILYHVDNRRNLVTGNVNDVNNITADELSLVYDNFYHPENMALVVTGNFNPYEVITIVKENQSNKKFKKYSNPVKIYDKEESSVVKHSEEIEGNIALPKVKLSYKIDRKKFKNYSDREIRLYSRILLNANFGATSDLREELFEKELVTLLRCDSNIISGNLVFSISFESKFAHEVIKIMQEKVSNLSITKQRLDRRIKCNIADMIYGFDDVEYMNNYIQESLITYGEIDTNYYHELKNLDINKAKEISRLMSQGNECYVLMNPKKNTNQND